MKLDTKLLGYIKIFENYTKTNVKDCFYNENELIFLVNKGQIGKAVGKKGENVKKLVNKLKQRVRVIAFDDDIKIFIRNLLYPLKDFDVELRENDLVLMPKDNTIKGKIYGRSRSNFKWLNEVLNRYFNDVKLVMDK